jgi:hypothetical protein
MKYNYYFKQLNYHKFYVWLKGEGVIKQAKLIHIQKFYYDYIPFSILATDTGMTNPQKIFDLFKKFGMSNNKPKMLVLTFETVEE